MAANPYSEKEELLRHNGMYCMECNQRIFKKSQLMPKHEGHDVRYLDEQGHIKE